MMLKPVRLFLVTCCVGGLAVGAAVAGAQGPGGGPPMGPPSPQQMMMPDMFLAAARGDAEGLKVLIARGADPNCRNFLSLTPLHIAAAAGQMESVRALLGAGAGVDTPSPYGTALTFAVMANQGAIAEFLLAKGADATPARQDRITPLMLAARSGDTSLAKLFIARGNGINAKDAAGATPLIYAARSGQVETAKLLISKGAVVDQADEQRWTPLMYAAANGNAEVAQLLLSKGADANARDDKGRTPLLLLANYSGDGPTMKALIAKKADVNVRDAKGRTVGQLLALRGYVQPTAALKGGTTTSRDVFKPDQAHAAAERAIEAIEFSTSTFQRKIQCASCHHQGLGLMATGLAKSRGFSIDTKLASEQQNIAVREFEAAAPMLKQAVANPDLAKLIPSAEIGDLTPAAAYMLGGVGAHGRPASPALSSLAVILARQQFPDGHWQFGLARVPMQSSPFTMTALTIRALKIYGAKENADEIDSRIRHAKKWLISTIPQSTEDRSFRLLALKWAGATDAERDPALREVLDAQRPDGGWATFPGSGSDAYATGQALYALNQGGGLPATNEAYRRGAAYLLRTQDDDGTWYLSKRAIPANNYMDAGFPHGESQYASYAATSWATMALVIASDAGKSGR